MIPRPSSRRPLPPELEAWLREHPGVSRSETLKLWQLAELGAPLPPPPVDPIRRQTTWAQLVDAATPSSSTDRTALRRARLPQWRWTVATLGLVLLLGIGLRLWLQPTKITAPEGTTRLVALPDGSHISLNSGTTVSYARDFANSHRTVRLVGEAFFEVTPQAMPFIVETFNAQVRVLGTKFNVRARESHLGSETMLEVQSGRVHFAPKASAYRPVLLVASQSSRLGGGATTPTPPATQAAEQSAAWQHGGFFFIDQPLGLIFEEIERRFATVIQADATIRAKRFTLFRHHVDEAVEVLTDLCQANQLHFRQTANGYDVYAE